MAEDFTAEELELLDPAPDIHALFQHYQTLYFDDKLGACSGAPRCLPGALHGCSSRCGMQLPLHLRCLPQQGALAGPPQWSGAPRA